MNTTLEKNYVSQEHPSSINRQISSPQAHSPERIMQLGFGFMDSKTLLSATELGLFTVLANGPLDGESL
jgi:hypothetical protein